MLPRMVTYGRWQANEDRQSSCVEKGVIMDLIVMIIGARDNITEVGVFCSMFQNVKFWVLDLDKGLDKGLRDTGEGEEK